MKIPNISPQETVERLNEYVIGQAGAKRALAVALRNRWRRQQLPLKERMEIRPRNILLIGTSGVGKTEIARRLADISMSPFVKIDATTLTEVGYVGGNVTDLTDALVEEARDLLIRNRPKDNTKDRIDEYLLKACLDAKSKEPDFDAQAVTKQYYAGALETLKINPVLISATGNAMPDAEDLEDLSAHLRAAMLSLAKANEHRHTTVAKERKVLQRKLARGSRRYEPSDQEILDYAANHGIIFIDEIDKIAIVDNQGRGGGVSRSGVQRDLLAIVEGTSVKTKYGFLRTDGVLFIAAGAFQMAKVEDLTPELRGRFPIRATLESLTVDDFKQIMRDSRTSLIRQYQSLLKTEGLDVRFTEEALDLISTYAYEENQRKENLGARRLQAVLEQILEDLSFTGSKDKRVTIDAAFIKTRLASVKL